MSQALTRYHALFESIRSRRRRPDDLRGLDALARRAGVRIRAARVNLAWLRREAQEIDKLAPEFRSSSDGVLDEYIERVRDQFRRGRAEDEIVRRGLALVREVARRDTGEEAFIVQLMGALALYHGRIVEMLTGEGKTLTGSLVAPLLAWKHRSLHIFTVNDYLASRDAQSRGAIYARCRCAVGAIVQEMEPAERFEVYARPIVYGTPKQITADWLRDQIRLGTITSAWAGRGMLSQGAGESAGPMIPGLRAAMVDEADAVLIDEGVVPLIIARSRRGDEMAEVYKQAAALAAKLDMGPDFTIDQLRRKAELKSRGEHRVDQMVAQIDGAIWRAPRRAEELVRQALAAKYCYTRGKHYEIVESRIVIVDEYTGRFLADRSWEHGLHQAVEAKEGLDVTADRETLARMSFQRFFRSYPFLCGMTGTAADATGEIESVYARPVEIIPTNRPIARAAWPMRVFRTQQGKWAAIAQSIEEVHRAGRPILAGTRSIAASELLSSLLMQRGLPHKVLNANFDKDEADLISGAGVGGAEAAITVATNMAGRGTDIKLDDAAREAGGLHVILTEMHGAKRIDRQFIGRAGRQGDPGSSQLFVSTEDELLSLHAAPLLRVLQAVQPSGENGVEIAGSELVARLFRYAQRQSEARDRRNRAGVLRQDDWIDKYLPGS
jgi:preprotein translocase subunit SecA